MRIFLPALLALLWIMRPASAQIRAMTQGAAFTLHDAVAAAWSRLPQLRSFAAREAVAAAKYASGSATFPNAPTATGNFVDDRIAGSNDGYVTSEVELSTPIWLPGEGTATQTEARAEAQAASADQEAMHLAVAEKVLQLVEQVDNAANDVAVATRRQSLAQALARAVSQRYALGESPQTDALASDAELANAEIALDRARAQAATALAAYAALTGLPSAPRLGAAAYSVMPCPLQDELAGSNDIPPAAQAQLEGNPRIVAARRAVEAAEAKARLVQIENRDNPEIGLQGINEKQPGTRWDSRMAVIFRLHFASEARNAPRRAAAEQAVTEAEVQLDLARREVMTEMCQSDLAAEAAQRSQEAAARAAASLDLRRGKIERAWRAGEMPLVEVIRANAMAFDADLARDKAGTDLAASRLRARLAQGLLP